MTNRLRRTLLSAAVAGAMALPAFAVDIPVPNIEVHIAHTRPPHLRFERRPPMPGPGYVWINGDWDWDGGRWVWVRGRWDRPAAPDVVWVRPHYRHEYGAYRYEPGHWSNQTVIEGNEYRDWREHHRHGDHDRDRDRDRDRDHQ